MSLKNQNIGECKLCLNQKELRISHYIPKSAYRLLQKFEDSQPVVVKPTITMQTNEQMQDYLLCSECERRFDENGERWVMQNCYRNEGFKLKELLDTSVPIFENNLKVYSAANVPQIDIEKLTYFVSSILWRGAVHTWRSGKDKIRTLNLGTKYEEELRNYLMGNTGFPRNAALWVCIIPTSDLSKLLTVPYGERIKQFWRYKFPFLGIRFTFFLGNCIDQNIRKYCIYRSPEKFIFSGDWANEVVIQDFGNLISNSRAVGSLNSTILE